VAGLLLVDGAVDVKKHVQLECRQDDRQVFVRHAGMWEGDE
jgi:hypothetical protein